jgi:hypothetical protein
MAVTKVTTELIEDSAVRHHHLHNDLVVDSTEGILSSNDDTTIPTALAVTSYVSSAVSSLVDSAPETLNTLNELASALNDDADFGSTVTNSLSSINLSLGAKVDGSGTINYIPKFVNTQVVGDSLLYDDGSAVFVNGELSVNGTLDALAIVELSAKRFKENINSDLDSSIVEKLNPVSFDWKMSKEKDYGFIAEEVNELDESLVAKDQNGEIIGVKYTKLIPFLVKKIQEQEERIIALENGKS